MGSEIDISDGRRRLFTPAGGADRFLWWASDRLRRGRSGTRLVVEAQPEMIDEAVGALTWGEELIAEMVTLTTEPG
jgi:hypothetical protein